ncbi:SHOCT domain-containing protein [Streptomyces sp. H27-H1]|uniref:SHOCT domain-containing protein n=1 Tax=Streptomyces sp. H27-H1 TaxID=2996461 RepID=UPI0022709F70|nr:SHOCT domain-containing protein [Streptomyces sp. H27-H1]MCY0927549.1 SHOCT domain-containing protein [Streptomyces sp. H27-H1]
MFIRPIGSVVNPSMRPTGHPLLRGILARGAYVWDAARHSPETPHTPHAPHTPDGADRTAARSTTPGAAPAPPTAASDRPGPSAGPGSAGASGGPGSPGGSEAPGTAAPGGDLTDRLTQLAALAREGLLTPEEFSAAKARLLSG